jgi:hypothetical protein
MSNHNEITPLPAVSRTGSFARVDLNEKSEKHEITHIEDDEATIRGAKHSVGLALIDQVNTIPSAGDRIVTTKKEYWSYVAFGQYLLSYHAGKVELMISCWCSWNWNWDLWRYHPAGAFVSAIPRWAGRVGREQYDLYVSPPHI